MVKTAKRRGVTLIELLIVVLILAALAAIAIPRVSQSAMAAKATACKTNIDIVNSAIERYRIDNGGYPPNVFTVTNNTVYFPDEVPQCPINGLAYGPAIVDYRADITNHNH